jgi:hypothetical protein
MENRMTASIPASYFVKVTPGVLAAGGTGLVLNGLLLTNSTQGPLGQVLSFPDEPSVSAYFGAASAEAAFAAQYFAGYTNGNQTPAALLITQYPETAVAAYLLGGAIAALPLISLQAVSGTLSVTVDGYVHSAASIDLSAATSFSAAAAIIQTDLNASLAAEGTSTTSTIETNTATLATIAGNILTIPSTSSVVGLFFVGQTISGGTILSGTTITALGTGTGGIGTYIVSAPQTVVATTITGSGSTLLVAGTVTGTWAVGQTVTGGTTAANTHIIGYGTGAGAAGSYVVDVAQTVVSAALASEATALLVTYNSTAGAFLIKSGVTGVASTIAIATGTAAAGLMLTTATGAVLSQGGAPATPAAFMGGIVAQTSNWASFTTLWEPSVTEGLGFSAWNSLQDDLYVYVAWDTDVTVIGTPSAFIGLGQQIIAAGYGGTHLVYAPVNMSTAAAFVMAFTASLLFTQTNGRATLAYKSAPNLASDVTSSVALANLTANGYNAYCAVATADEQFTYYYPGTITGPFTWFDTYINQIWLNSNFQLDMLLLLTQVKSIPYNADGDTLIRSSVMDTIAEAGNFGIFRAGVTLSTLQIAEVNSAAGRVIAPTLAAQGWYLLSNAAGTVPSVRQARGSPPFSFWYMDGESVQKLNLQSVVLQ